MSDKDVPVLDELHALFEIQKERIAMDVKSEKKLSKLFKKTRKEIQVAVEILDRIDTRQREVRPQ